MPEITLRLLFGQACWLNGSQIPEIFKATYHPHKHEGVLAL